MARSTNPQLPILVVDDETSTLSLFRAALYSRGMNNVILCADSREALSFFASREIGVVLLDLTMPHVSGGELLRAITQDHPEVPVIVVTGMDEVQTAVECMKGGAFDYMVKPVEENRLLSGVARAMELRDLRRENTLLRDRVLRDTIECPQAFEGLITQNGGMQAVFRYVDAVAKSSQPVLITGETGTGKELIARAVHTASGRPGAFVAVNVAGLDDTLFSDALFGHEKGAYTGAEESRPGFVSEASGGTLFLDEIGDLTPVSQMKLLRLLQEGEYHPLGSTRPQRSDARIAVATNRNLVARRDSGQFRADLFYRLQTHQVHVPPLRERRDDLPLLLEHFLEKAARSLGKPTPTPPHELQDLLGLYDFPGNVRELESMVFDAVSRHRAKTLSTEAFRERIAQPVPDTAPAAHPLLRPVTSAQEFPKLRATTQFLLSEALRLANGNQALAAQLLGISRPALNRRLRRIHEGQMTEEEV